MGGHEGELGGFQNLGISPQFGGHEKQGGGKKGGVHSIGQGCNCRAVEGTGSIKIEKVTRQCCESIMTVHVS